MRRIYRLLVSDSIIRIRTELSIAKMKCFKICVVMTLVFINIVHATDNEVKHNITALLEQIEILKNQHRIDIIELKKEIEELKFRTITTNNHERNEQVTLQWAKSSMQELRTEIKELGESINNSLLLRQLHVIRNELKQALMETSDLAQLARTQEARLDKLDADVGRLKYDVQQMRSALEELRVHINKLSKEIKVNQIEELNNEMNNEIMAPHDDKVGSMNHVRHHRIRHNKMVHVQISRLAHTQDQVERFQQNLQTQILDVQRRLDRFEEPNWHLITAKLEFLELSTKVMEDELKNTTQKVSDLDKVHASILELREDLESVENKADKTVPEFRKEISKLDVSYAQLNAQFSYIKENQENLRQSVKAIAVSVSNTIDRTDLDRMAIKKINESMCELEERSKRHFYRLNDHILKSEANVSGDNVTATIPLPQLMGEVKELQPVQHEYEDLVSQLPKDCSSISGPADTYLIRPGHAPVDTWCVNGSTLIQRRYNGSVEFNRKFYEYVNGFGNPASEYWLGLESMHLLTSDNCSAMRIDMTDIYGNFWYAQYESFYVGNADSGYVLEVGGFKGNASDAFAYQNHMEFSAIDRDRDISNTHCAGNYEGGWWFSHCQHVNINGKYSLGLTWFDAVRNEWIAVATSEMRMYRHPECS